jgi:hypothetical protein
MTRRATAVFTLRHALAAALAAPASRSACGWRPSCAFGNALGSPSAVRGRLVGTTLALRRCAPSPARESSAVEPARFEAPPSPTWP